MSTRQVKKIVARYADELRKNQISFRHIYLYGSHATGTAQKYSDIDIAVVVTNAGRGKKYLEKKSHLWTITPNVDTRIEPILLEEKELKRGEESIIGYEVKKHGLRIL